MSRTEPLLISSTESSAFRALGTSTTRPEEYGVDAFWVAQKQTWGVQRKALKDLVASVEDGRLAKERLQWHSLDHVYLVVETGERGGGAPREMPNGALAALGTYGRPWTGPQYRSLLLSLASDGAQVLTTKDEPETIARVVELEKWSRKDRHQAVRTRGHVPTDVFGRRESKEYGVWLMSSLPGVGIDTATKIWDHFGGLPLAMKEGIGVKELTEVPGIGKVTANRILAVFGGRET